MDVDVGSLSNEQLKIMLNKFGVSPGPIVGATRRVYENKLKKLLVSSNGGSPSPPPPPSSQQDVSVILDDNSIDLTSPQPLESTRDDEVIIVNGMGGGFGRNYAAAAATRRRTPSPPPASAQYKPSPTNIFSSSSSSSPPMTTSTHFSTVRTPPVETIVADDDQDDDDRMEGEERIRFVAPPTFDDDRDEDDRGDFEQETTKIRQRTNIGAGHTPKLYPTLVDEPTPTSSWRRGDYGRFDRQFSASGGDSTNVSSSSAAMLRPSVSARKATPGDVYTNSKLRSSSTGLPIWLKIGLCFLITIFVVMLTRRLLDNKDSDDYPTETMHFDE